MGKKLNLEKNSKETDKFINYVAFLDNNFLELDSETHINSFFGLLLSMDKVSNSKLEKISRRVKKSLGQYVFEPEEIQTLIKAIYCCNFFNLRNVLSIRESSYLKISFQLYMEDLNFFEEHITSEEEMFQIYDIDEININKEELAKIVKDPFLLSVLISEIGDMEGYYLQSFIEENPENFFISALICGCNKILQEIYSYTEKLTDKIKEERPKRYDRNVIWKIVCEIYGV